MYRMFLERLKVPMFLEVQQLQKTPKKRKKISNDVKPQITTAATEVNSPPQEASDVSLNSSSHQEPKLKGGFPFAREEELPQVTIRRGCAERKSQAWSSQALCPPCGGSDHKRSSSINFTNYRRSSNSCNYCQSIPSIPAKKKWNKYGERDRIYDPGPD